MSTPAASRSRRASILLVVLVVVTLAALAGSSATYLATAELRSAPTAMQRIQARALAWSGVQAVMAELSQQRQSLIDGQSPNLTEQWELFTDSSGRRAVVRLVPIEDDQVITSEQARIDINTATQAMLEAVGFAADAAAAIIVERDRGAFSSPADLLRVTGVTPATLFGDGWDASDEPLAVRSPGSLGRNAPPQLIDRLTVFSFDPNIQAGIGPNASQHRGKLRINLNTPWSERLGRAIDDRFGPGTGAAAQAIMARGIRIDSLGVLVRTMSAQNLDRQAWPYVFDAFTVTDDQFVRGCIDLNRAPEAVLACIPGISTEAASRIVQARGQLGDHARRSILWPFTENILSPEDMASAADHLTTRSMQWRVRVEGGFIAAEDRRSWRDLEGEILRDRVVLEAVIDIASERSRVAYLRDVTMLPIARLLAAGLAAEEAVGDLLEPERSSLPNLNPEPFWTGPATSAPVPSFGTQSGDRNAGPRIPEPAGRGPIQADAEVGTSGGGGDPRIGRWTPGPTGKDGAP